MSAQLSRATREAAIAVAAVKRVWWRIEARIAYGDPLVCWPWRGATDTNGYGHVRVASRVWKAHRAVFLKHHGFLPEVVMHTCDNPPCCNPLHLRAGTKALNNDDKMQKGRHRPVHGDANGARRHPERLSRGNAHYSRREPNRLARGEDHGMSKLTREDVRDVRSAFAAGGVTKATLARRYGTGQPHIGRIIAGENWK